MIDFAHAPHPIRDPAEDEATHLQRWRDFMRLGSEQCDGYSDGIRAALINMVCRLLPHVKARDLLTFPDHRLWGLGLAAYEADPAVLDALPDTITAALTRGERIALAWGLKKQAPALPTGKDAIELGAAIFGPLMGEVLRDIAFPLARRMATA